MTRSVAIRLGTEGKAQVVADLDAIGNSGDAAAKRWAKSFERAGNDAEAALQRQARAAEKLAAIMPQTAIQMRIGDANGTGFGQWEGSARRSAAAFRELYDEQDRLAAKTHALRAAIDPAYAAQARFDTEMRSAKTLIAAGTISLDEYCTKLRIERAALDAATAAQLRGATSAGAHRAAMQGLSYQVQDAFTQLSMGANPLNVLAIQGAQAAGQMAGLEGKLGSVAKFMVGGWGLAITGGLLLLGALTDHLLDGANAADEMAKHQEALAGIIDRTTGRIKDQNQALIQNAILTARKDATDARKAYVEARQSFIGYGSTIPGVTDLQRQYAAGDKTASQVSAELARITRGYLYNSAGYQQAAVLQGLLKDVVTTARTGVSAQAQTRLLSGAGRPGDAAIAFGDFSGGQGRHSNTTLLDAQAKLQSGNLTALQEAEARLTVARQKAKDELDRGIISEKEYTARLAPLEAAVNSARKSTDRHAASLGRQSAAMNVNAAASLELARAYLRGGDAAIRAEAARKGLTDATKKGIDGEAQAERQLQVMIGEQIANGAKSVAQLRDETIARAAVNAQVAAGALPVEAMNRALADEAALRPLLKLQTLAQGEALTVLTTVIGDYRKALRDAHDEEAKGNAERAIATSKDRVEELKASIRDLGKSPLDQAIAQAKRAAGREADAQGFNAPDRADYVAQKATEARATAAADQARYVIDTLRGQRDSIVLGERELQLIAGNDDYRAAELEKLKIALDLRRRFPEMAREDVDAILRGVDAQAAMNGRLDEARTALGELLNYGTHFVDEVFDVRNWDDWGEAGKRILQDLEQEFVTLAALNPLKNWVFGEKNPTIGSVGGLLGSLFGGGGGTSFGDVQSWLDGLGHNAAGTEHWSGGMTWLAENGPELVNLPAGAKITPAAETRRMMAANDVGAGGVVRLEISLNGDLLDARIDNRAAGVSVAVVRQAAPQIADTAANVALAKSGRMRL